MPIYIQKRNGRRALFEAHKIHTAMKKAFIALQGASDEAVLNDLTAQVVELLGERSPDTAVPSVEYVQDLVERVLMRGAYHEVAKAYILYRARHQQQREAERLADIAGSRVMVLSGAGERVAFDVQRLRSRLGRLVLGLPSVDVTEVVEAVLRGVFSDMTLRSVEDLLVHEVKSRIERHYQYSALAARVVLDGLYRRLLHAGLGEDALGFAHAQGFAGYVQQGVELELLDTRLLEFDLEKLAGALRVERDLEFHYLGMQTLADRYLLRVRQGEREPFELPQWLWMRVAMGMALAEKEDRTAWAIRFYEVLSSLQVVSSTPTLFNSGTTHSQMSSCYLNAVEDSMEGIFRTYSDCAQLSKWAGGIGTDWTAVRSKGAAIRGTNGVSQGVVPFLKIFNDVALAVNQGGKRKGALCAYLELWHRDVEEFLELKKNTGDERRRTHDIHTAVMIPDLFMQRVRAKGNWTLFSPDTVPGLQDAFGQDFVRRYTEAENAGLPYSVQVPALELWRKLLTMLYETGHPWITFKDAMNVRNPQQHAGVIHNSNLCTEITLNTGADETAVCNLASLNLARMVENGALDEGKVRSAVTLAIRMLDNVIDQNFYPIEKARNANMRHRPVGLGLMGYQDALYQLGIEFDSAENVEFADTSMELISHAALLASAQLAAERGAYPSYEGSLWSQGILPLDSLDKLEIERGVAIPVPRGARQDWESVRKAIRTHGMRNSNTLAIAPTATISNIAGTVPCVEPSFRNLYMKENLSGNFVVINRHLVDALAARGLWNEQVLQRIKYNNGSVLGVEGVPADIQRLFKETFEIDPHWILEAASRRSKWIDQSASTNIFIKTTSGKVLSEVYQRAWELGLKTTYYLRTLAASQVTRADGGELEPIAEIKACSITNPDCEACQ